MAENLTKYPTKKLDNMRSPSEIGSEADVEHTFKSQVKLTAHLISGALAGKVLGFVREIEMARLLGANIVADCFRGALTATLLPIAPMQGDMLPAVLIPLHRHWRSVGVAPEYFTVIIALFGTISIIITAIVFIFASQWVDIVVGGFGSDAHDLAIRFVRVMAMAMPASTLSACMSSIEISIGRSRITTIRASMSNIGVIIGIIIMSYTGEAIAVAWGYVIAFNLVMLYGGTKLVHDGELKFSAIQWHNLKPAVNEFYRRMKPLFIQPLADQGNILFERYLGSTFATGTLASLDYARTLTETALYLVSQPLGYVMLSQPAAKSHDVHSRVKAVSWPLLALMLPATLFLCVFARDIVSLVFHRGQFQDHAIYLTSNALRCISLGLWASTLGWVLIRMINAQSRNGTAARIIFMAYMANITTNLVLWLATSVDISGLGLGEATRGLVMLIGASIMLGCGRLILRQVLQLTPILMMLLMGSILIFHTIDNEVLRLLSGAALYAIGTSIGLRNEIIRSLSSYKISRQARHQSVHSIARHEL